MEEIVNEKSTGKGLNLIDLWINIQKYWVQMLSISLAVAVAIGILAYNIVPVTWTARSTMNINANSIYENVANTAANAVNSKNYGLSMFQTINDFLTETRIIRTTVENLSEAELKTFYGRSWANDISDEDFEKVFKDFDRKCSGSISCSRSSNDTLNFRISYKSYKSKEDAMATVNALSLALIKVANTPKVDENGNEVEGYSYPFGGMIAPVDLAHSYSISHNWKIFPIIAFLGTFVILYLYFLLISLFDESVRSKQEIEEITGFNVIAYIEDLTDKKNKKRS